MLFSSRYISIVLLFTALQLNAQSSEPLALATEPIPSVQSVAKDRLMPALPSEDLLPYIHRQLSYPEIAVENGVEGTVIIDVSVSSAGEVTRTSVRQSVQLLDEAALEAVSNLPALLPAVENGWPVARRLLIPIRFRLR